VDSPNYVFVPLMLYKKASTHSTEEHNSYYSMPSDLGLKQKK